MMNQSITIKDIEIAAKKKLNPAVFDYIHNGSFYEETVKENVEAFKHYKIRPRVLRNVASLDLGTSFLGNKIALPVGLSPVAFQKLSHPDGEIATGQAAMKIPTVMALSSWANVSVEQLTAACPSLICLQHLPITKPPTYTIDILRRAETSSVKGFIVTVDHQVKIMKSKASIDAKWGNSSLKTLYDNSVKEYDDVMFHGSTTWEDISWLKTLTSLPVILKGIQTADDALLALKYGADAIWVSNHGGRQLDSARAAIDILPEVVEAVNGKCEVYVDGGFRTGIDVFKGLALGARVVFIGRPIHYGLACGGEEGVTKVLDILRTELDNTMALSGCCNLSEITRSMITTQVCKL